MLIESIRSQIINTLGPPFHQPFIYFSLTVNEVDILITAFRINKMLQITIYVHKGISTCAFTNIWLGDTK